MVAKELGASSAIEISSAAASSWRRAWQWPRVRSLQTAFYDKCNLSLALKPNTHFSRKACVHTLEVRAFTVIRIGRMTKPQNQIRCCTKESIQLIFAGPTEQLYSGSMLSIGKYANSLHRFPQSAAHNLCDAIGGQSSSHLFLFDCNVIAVWSRFLCRSAIWYGAHFKFIELISIKIAAICCGWDVWLVVSAYPFAPPPSLVACTLPETDNLPGLVINDLRMAAKRQHTNGLQAVQRKRNRNIMNTRQKSMKMLNTTRETKKNKTKNQRHCQRIETNQLIRRLCRSLSIYYLNEWPFLMPIYCSNINIPIELHSFLCHFALPSIASSLSVCAPRKFKT